MSAMCDDIERANVQTEQIERANSGLQIARLAAVPSGCADEESGVKDDLTPKRAGRVVETAEYAAFVRRILRAYGRRLAVGDAEALPDLLALAGEVDAVIGQAVAGLRKDGYSWSEIGAGLGTTKQAAQQRFGRQAAEQ